LTPCWTCSSSIPAHPWAQISLYVLALVLIAALRSG
jgi:hypothetical protein